MKMFKCFFLLFCLTASLYAVDWDGSSSEPKSTKEIDGKTFYVITSAEELAWFAEQVNGGASEINAVLANDIHFMDDTSKTSSVDWTTIGRITTVMFNGTFDGAGRTIYGLYLIGGGLFGVTGENAVIRNVSLVKAKMEMVEYGGGIVAINGGTVSGCTNRSSVFILPYQSRCYLGGIVGWNKGRVTGCMNDGDFFFGGMFYMSGVGDSLYGGGVVGRNEGTVDDCINRGLFGYDDKFAKFFHFGGIVGWNGGKVSKCINSGGGGFCSSSNGGYCSIKYENRFIGGGITSHNAGSVRDCLNFGSFSRKGNSGGLVGSADSSSNLFNSYSAADSATSGVGAEYGVTNCYYDSDILESASSIARLKLHTSDMQSDRFAWILNTTNGTAENSGVWSRDSEDYPIFADSLHKPIYKVIFDDSVETTNRYTNYNGFVVFPKDPEPPVGKKFSGWYADDSIKVEETTVFTKDQTIYALYCEPSSCPTDPSDALVANLPSPTWSITASGRNFQVHAAPVGKPYALFDLQGKVLAKGRVESPEMTLSTPRAGSYIVRVGERSVRMNAK